MDGEFGYSRIRWRSKCVSSLLPNNKPLWRHNSNNRANLPRPSRALWRMLWTHFIAEDCREPLGTTMNLRVDRRIRFWMRYVWTGKFLNPCDRNCHLYTCILLTSNLMIFLVQFGINTPYSKMKGILVIFCLLAN